MSRLPTAKLILSDYLNSRGKACLPGYPNKVLIEKVSLLLGLKIPKLIPGHYMAAIINLSEIIDESGEIKEVDALSCFYSSKKPKVKKRKKKSKNITKFTNTDRRWRELRYKVLKLSNGSCCLCGATAKDGIKLHVDHIKPKSIYPYLEYDLNNLQVLCEDCNIGKSNKDDTDWR